MRFKDKNGMLYDDLRAAITLKCGSLSYGREMVQRFEGTYREKEADCTKCPLSVANNGTGQYCTEYAITHPYLAAEVLGLEVVDIPTNTPTEMCNTPTDRSTTVKLVEIDRVKTEAKKPLKDWTLGEVKAECASRINCEGCAFEKSVFCETERYQTITPNHWDLTEPYRYTKEEKTVIEYICSCYGLDNTGYITRHSDCYLILHGDHETIYLPAKMLPWVNPGEAIKLTDILGRD